MCLSEDVNISVDDRGDRTVLSGIIGVMRWTSRHEHQANVKCVCVLLTVDHPSTEEDLLVRYLLA